MAAAGATNGARWRRLVAVLVVAVALVAAACSSSDDGGGGAAAPVGSAPADDGYPRDDELRLDQIQVVGSHNSYHRRLQPDFAEGLEDLFPGLTAEWDYEHEPLPVQLADQGVRQIELDVWADPEGGRYATRRAQAYAGLPEDPGIPELAEPGLKVLHIQEVDVESTCWTFTACLTEVRDWSDANPGHVPVLILVEAKADELPDPLGLGFLPPIPFDAGQLQAIDDEILSVFDRDRVLTPDDVRGGAATLEEAVLTTGWPVLGDVRGKVLFALDNPGEVMEAYQAGHPSLEGRVMFTGGDPPGTPETAFLKLNDPVGDEQAIRRAVAAGYLVRTRADADPQLDDRDPVPVRDLALATGAQFVSTDFLVPNPTYDPDYRVAVPGGTPGRCNPVSAPDWCTPADVEDPALLAG